MAKNVFLNHILDDNQKVVSLMGPSGTGKTYSAGFLEKYLNYKIAKQITTRDPRPDDTYYQYISRQEFVRLDETGEILGFFSGDRNLLQGNGYGYRKEDLLEQIQKYQKIVLFSSAYELLQSEFKNDYGSSSIIGIGYRDANNVLQRVIQAKKVMPEEEIKSRIETAKKLTHIMEQYDFLGDDSFKLIYTDGFETDNIKQSKMHQLESILNFIGCDCKSLNEEINDYIER